MSPALVEVVERAVAGELVQAFVTLPESLELVAAGASVEPLTDWEAADGVEWAWVTVEKAAS